MRILFYERDLISCVFHLGKIKSRGSTSYYNGTSPDSPGQRVHQVQFQHGTLRIGFFNKFLHGVGNWEGHRSGIQLNIKKDVFKHFVKYGTYHYGKYWLTGYAHDPIVFFF